MYAYNLINLLKVAIGGSQVDVRSHGVPETLSTFTWESVHALGLTVKALEPCWGLATGATSRAIMEDKVKLCVDDNNYSFGYIGRFSVSVLILH